MQRINSFQQSVERYRILRVIAVLFTQLGAVLMEVGIVLLVLAVYAFFWGTEAAPPQGAGPVAGLPVKAVPWVPWLSATAALFLSFGLLVSGVQMLAMGTLCRLMIHLEENTRATAQALDKIQSRLETRSEGLEPFFRS